MKKILMLLLLSATVQAAVTLEIELDIKRAGEKDRHLTGVVVLDENDCGSLVCEEYGFDIVGHECKDGIVLEVEVSKTNEGEKQVIMAPAVVPSWNNKATVELDDTMGHSSTLSITPYSYKE